MSASQSNSGGAAGSTSQQASEMTRNVILGVPKGGLSPNSEEAAELHAAEVFISDIQQEILAYDIANAQAMEAYARRWWSYVPILGRHTRRALEAEVLEKAEQAQQGTRSLQQQQQSASAATEAGELGGGLAGLDAAKAAEAAAAAGGAFLHTQTSRTKRGGFQVERTSAVDQAVLDDMLKRPSASASPGATPAPPRKMNTWLFKKKHPGWTPLMQRRWVPWVCVGALVLVWTPDVWKLRAMYYCDWRYAMLRQCVHKAYWRATMSKEDYDTLIADVEAMRPSSVKSSDCPF